jgi:hypothetical protein
VSKPNCFIVKVTFVEAQMEQYNFDFCEYGPLGPRRVLFKNLNKTDTFVKH